MPCERDAWIIDGFDCVKSARERFASADTLVSIDLPLLTHFLRVTKRLLKGQRRYQSSLGDEPCSRFFLSCSSSSSSRCSVSSYSPLAGKASRMRSVAHARRIQSSQYWAGLSSVRFVGRSEEHTSELQSRGHLV